MDNFHRYLYIYQQLFLLYRTRPVDKFLKVLEWYTDYVQWWSSTCTLSRYCTEIFTNTPEGRSYHSVICRHWFIISKIWYKNGGLVFFVYHQRFFWSDHWCIMGVSLIQFSDPWLILYQWYSRWSLCITSVGTDKITVNTQAQHH